MGASFAACAADPTPVDPAITPEEAPPPPEAPEVDAEAGREALNLVAVELEAGRTARAANMADSLFHVVKDEPGMEELAGRALVEAARAREAGGELREAVDLLSDFMELPLRGEIRAEAARAMAELQIRLVDDPAAVRVLLDEPERLDGEARALLRHAVQGMDVEELERSLERTDPHPDPGRSILEAELAVALQEAGRMQDARTTARRLLEHDGVPEPERERARGVLADDGDRASPASRMPTVKVGVVLPLSGRYETVGQSLLEGIELSLARRQEDSPRRLELEVLDEAAEGATPEVLIRSLEESEVAAVVGPFRSAELEQLLEARRDSGLLVVSPTANEMRLAAPMGYTLWDRERREVDPARALGRWLGQRAGVGPAGVLYPDHEAGTRALLAFREGLAHGSGWVAAIALYEPGATTFRLPVTAVSAFDPEAVFVVGGDPSSILQLAPQLSFYGIRAAVVAGGPIWGQPETLRRLEPSVTQYRIVGVFVDRTREDGPWDRFQSIYEREYRKPLGNNILPALGYDAFEMIAEAVERSVPPRHRAVARRFAASPETEGATGYLTPDAATGTVARRVLIRRIEDRGLAEVDPTEVRRWLDQSGWLEAAEIRRQRARARSAVEREERLRERREEERSTEEAGRP